MALSMVGQAVPVCAPQVLKDIIVKYQLLAGRRAKYVPGWDCHGLPIELKVTNRHGLTAYFMHGPFGRYLCLQRAITVQQHSVAA
jgi:isoleucyl-tRNA synthetase